MHKFTLILSMVCLCGLASGQNIFTALRLNEKSEYKTRKPKKIVETNTFFGSGHKQLDKNIKVFDNAGMLVTEERYDENSNLTARLTYTNDTVHRICLSRIFQRWTSVGYFVETAVHVYDSNFFLIGTTDKDANGNVIQQTNLVCNEKGHPVELLLLDGNGNSFGKETATYFYEMNKVATCVVANDGRVLSCDTMKISYVDASRFPERNEIYNAKGDPLHWTSRRLGGTEIVYEEEYNYDSYGNCTEERIYRVTRKRNGEQKRQKDRIFKKEYFY